MELLLGFVIICMGLLGLGNSDYILDVTKFGAVGDGKTDDSQAFLKAWGYACGSRGHHSLQIPSGKIFLIQPLAFNGPCKSTIRIELEGSLAIPSPSEWKSSQKNTWISFYRVEGLTIVGSGKIDGRGEPWWKAGKDSPRPTSLSFQGCNNLQLKGITSMNTPRNHISMYGCSDSMISNINLIAPGDSPNTDGINIGGSSRVNILDSFISTGDDCVGILAGVVNLNITNVNCGPGHGLSVGSLGGARATVEQVRVKKCTFNRTQNGARIKTWPGTSGYAKSISYEDITLIEVGNPIIIDQNYGNPHYPGGASAVEISDIKFTRFHGTAAGKNAIWLDCSKVKGCNNVVLEDVNIRPGAKVKELSVVCNNAHGTSQSTVPRVPCLSGS